MNETEFAQDEIRRGESLKMPSSATPQTREFFSRMSADGKSPASIRAARITETNLQEADDPEAQTTLVGVGKQIKKVASIS